MWEDQQSRGEPEKQESDSQFIYCELELSVFNSLCVIAVRISWMTLRCQANGRLKDVCDGMRLRINEEAECQTEHCVVQ